MSDACVVLIFCLALVLIFVWCEFACPNNYDWLYNTKGYMVVENRMGKREKVLLSPMTYYERQTVINAINNGEWFLWDGVYYNPRYILEIHIKSKVIEDGNV